VADPKREIALALLGQQAAPVPPEAQGMRSLASLASYYPVPSPEPARTGAILPISHDVFGNTSFDSNAGLLGLAKRAFTLPGDVMSGRLPMWDADGHTSREAIRRGADLAGLMTLGAGAVPAGGGVTLRAGLSGLRQRYAPQLNEAVNWSKDIGRIKLTPERVEAAKASLQRTLESQPRFGEGPSPYRLTDQAQAAAEYAAAARRAGIEDTRVKFADGPYGSVYVRIGDHGTVRFADHPAPQEWVTNPLTGQSELQAVGGFSRDLGRRHQPATVDTAPARRGAPLNTQPAYDFLAALLRGDGV